MVLRVDILIYIYIALCACTYIYDFVYTRRKGRSKSYHARKRKACKKLILKLSRQEKSPKTRRKLVGWLRKPAFAVFFHDFVMERLQDEDRKERMQEWIWDNRDIFLEIRDTYVDTNRSNRKAFYAYMIWQYKLCGKDSHDAFVKTMQALVMDASIYCRENALSALYIAGDAANVTKAYTLMVKNDIHHSPKLITEGLLTFAGDHKAMAEDLWKNRRLFTSAYEVAFINYIGMSSGGFEERFMNILEDENTELEVRLAIIRYYRSHPCHAATEFMQNAVLHWEEYPWEMAVQAALVLDKSPSFESIRALMRGCESGNWYIRKNSAESILKITNGSLERMIVKNEEDRYGREMLEYILCRK